MSLPSSQETNTETILTYSDYWLGGLMIYQKLIKDKVWSSHKELKSFLKKSEEGSFLRGSMIEEEPQRSKDSRDLDMSFSTDSLANRMVDRAYQMSERKTDDKVQGEINEVVKSKYEEEMRLSSLRSEKSNSYLKGNSQRGGLLRGAETGMDVYRTIDIHLMIGNNREGAIQEEEVKTNKEDDHMVVEREGDGDVNGGNTVRIFVEMIY